MSYRCGVGPSLARAFEYAGETRPHIICDRCGATRVVDGFHGVAPVWFMDGRPPPGWRGSRSPDDTRIDLCPKCWKDGKK